jgi:hypothetical protein
MRKLFLALGFVLVLAAGGAVTVTFPSQPAMARCGSGNC